MIIRLQVPVNITVYLNLSKRCLRTYKVFIYKLLNLLKRLFKYVLTNTKYWVNLNILYFY